MSTHYAPLKRISAADLFDGRLEEFGVREHFEDIPSKTARWLTDGCNGLSVYISGDEFVDSLTRRGANAPGNILSAIEEVFDTDIVSEYEPQYWGFDTQEEWDAWEEQRSREAADRFHSELLKYLRGEPNDIKPGTIGMIKAKIATKLLEKEPALLLPTNKDRFRKEIDTIYDREHVVKVTLGPADIVAAEMLVTLEDDLPRA
jgi:hypothetical protein